MLDRTLPCPSPLPPCLLALLQSSSVVVRCNCVQPDSRSGTRMVNDEFISLYVEFSTSYRLTVEDTVCMPPSERKVGQRGRGGGGSL
jgi:hypothetical protein